MMLQPSFIELPVDDRQAAEFWRDTFDDLYRSTNDAAFREARDVVIVYMEAEGWTTEEAEEDESPMSDQLPSRETVAAAIASPAIPISGTRALLEAYVSGRLVDREAIDTVWVCVEKSSDSAGWRVTNMPGSPSSCYFSGGAHTPMSDLPSRESIADELAQLATTTDLFDALPPGALFNILIIASEWASGRLVDREAIDYEAAQELIVNRWRQFFPEITVTPELRVWLWALMQDLLDAVLGVSDEPQGSIASDMIDPDYAYDEIDPRGA